MRVQHCIAAMLALSLLPAFGREASAQGEPPYYGQPPGQVSFQRSAPTSWGHAGESSPVPYGGEPGYLPHDQSQMIPPYSPLNYSAPGAASFPESMTSWPNISPYYGPSFNQLHHTDGLWSYDTSTTYGRRFFGSVEYLRGRFRKPDGLVGHPGAMRYKDFILPIIHEDPINLPNLADAFQGDAPNDDFLLDGLQDQVGFFPQVGQPGFNYFDRASAREVGHPKSNGIRLRWGFLEPDETGLQIDGWWTGFGEAEFDAEDGVARRLVQPGLLFRILDDQTLGFLTPIDPFTNEQVLGTNLMNLRGLPINDGTLEQLVDGRFIGGTTVPYDLEFNLRFKSQAAGTSVNVLMMPIVKKKYLKVRPLLGARYMYVKEEFNFFGHDSGLSYDNQDVGDPIFPRLKLHSLPNFFDDNDDGNIDDPGVVEDPIDATTEARFIRLDLVAQILGVEHPGRYQAFIDNVTVSHLIGPEAGLQYDIGGDRLKVHGHTKFALLGNFEKMNLKGNNIGDAHNIGTAIDISDPTAITGIGIQDSPLITPTDDNPNPNFFRDDVDHGHVSPAVEQAIFVDVPVFEYVPYLKRMQLFEEAKLTFGFTYMFVAELARPTESIIYNANPRAGLFPTLDVKRGNWWTSNWSVGVEIPY